MAPRTSPAAPAPAPVNDPGPQLLEAARALLAIENQVKALQQEATEIRQEKVKPLLPIKHFQAAFQLWKIEDEDERRNSADSLQIALRALGVGIQEELPLDQPSSNVAPLRP